MKLSSHQLESAPNVLVQSHTTEAFRESAKKNIDERPRALLAVWIFHDMLGDV